MVMHMVLPCPELQLERCEYQLTGSALTFSLAITGAPQALGTKPLVSPRCDRREDNNILKDAE